MRSETLVFRLSDRAFVEWWSGGVVNYIRLLADGSYWWEREVLNVEQFEMALAEKLLPPNAKIAAMDREGKGDLSPWESIGSVAREIYRKRLSLADPQGERSEKAKLDLKRIRQAHNGRAMSGSE